MADFIGLADIHVTLDTSEIRGLHDPNTFLNATYATVVGPATKFLAYGAQEGLKTLLGGASVKGYVVKASGESSENLGIGAFSEGAATHKGHFVYEGGRTQGNKFIREGSTGGKNRPTPPPFAIGAWLLRKGGFNFSYKPISAQISGGTSISKGRTEMQEQVWRIVKGIQKRGTSTMHKPLYPGNARRYDYVRYAVVKLRMIDQLFAVLSKTELPMLNRILIKYLRTGRYNEGSAYASIKVKRGII